MKYSIIVFLEDSYEDFPEFIKNLNSLFSALNAPFEILIMANGTGGFLRNQMKQLEDLNHRLKAFELSTKSSEAVCLQAALKESAGEIILVCGSYQQITTDSLRQALVSLDDHTDIVNPWRQKRVDPPFNQFQSKVFNFLVRKITSSNLHDLSCTVRVYRRQVLEETEVYGNMYRFLPIVAARRGFKTIEVKCEHQQERGRTGFYDLSSYITRLIDIFTLYFNTRFTRKPLRFFSAIGTSFFIIGFLIALYVFLQKVFMGIPIGGRSVLLLALLSMVLGVQASSVGLLGEIITFTHARHKREYSIQKII